MQQNQFEVLESEKALRLSKLAESGIQLDRVSKEIVNQYDFDKQNDPDNQNEFGVWFDKSEWIVGWDRAPGELLKEPIEDLMVKIEKWSFKPDILALQENVLRDLFLRRPDDVLIALCRLAQDGIWQQAAWQICISGIKGLEIEKIRELGLLERINDVLNDATDIELRGLGYAALDYLSLIASLYSIDQEKEYSKLWLRVWKSVDQEQCYLVNRSDAIENALNSPAGKMAESVLTRFWKYRHEVNSGLPNNWIKECFDEIGCSRDGFYGRVILSMKLFTLHEIAPEWTTKNLIQRMLSVDTDESKGLWLAYSRSQRIGPNLLAEIKEPFVKALAHPSDLPIDLRKQLTTMFISICMLAPPNSLSQMEKNAVVSSMTDDMLENVLIFFRDSLFFGDEDERAEIWRNKIRPWLEEFWPGNVKTPQTSEILLQILAYCESEFVQAAEWILNFLTPVKEASLHPLEKITMTKQSAAVTLQILQKVMPNKSVQDSQSSILQTILDNVKEGDQALGERPQFNRLYRMASS